MRGTGELRGLKRPLVPRKTHSINVLLGPYVTGNALETPSATTCQRGGGRQGGSGRRRNGRARARRQRHGRRHRRRAEGRSGRRPGLDASYPLAFLVVAFANPRGSAGETMSAKVSRNTPTDRGVLRNALQGTWVGVGNASSGSQPAANTGRRSVEVFITRQGGNAAKFLLSATDTSWLQGRGVRSRTTTKEPFVRMGAAEMPVEVTITKPFLRNGVSFAFVTLYAAELGGKKQLSARSVENR